MWQRRGFAAIGTMFFQPALHHVTTRSNSVRATSMPVYQLVLRYSISIRISHLLSCRLVGGTAGCSWLLGESIGVGQARKYVNKCLQRPGTPLHPSHHPLRNSPIHIHTYILLLVVSSYSQVSVILTEIMQSSTQVLGI